MTGRFGRYGASTSGALACAQEPIHLPGAIQPHGALLAIDSAAGFTVVAASRNAAALLGGFGAVTGRGIDTIVGPDFAAGLRRRFETGGLRGEAPWQFSLAPAGARQAALKQEGHENPFGALHFDVHAHGGLILVEVERAGALDQARALSSLRGLQEAIVELRTTPGVLERLAHVTAQGIRALIGYERVLIYRFDAEWNGQALGEDKTDDWQQSLDGLHFPASDIPAQARELYRRSPMRWVPDRDARPVMLDIDPARLADLPPTAIDLSFARLRALSPIHLQYHRNMGVNGSMSLSVLVEDRLWGLVVCHHREPHHPAPCDRLAALALAEAFALRVGPAGRTGIEEARRGDLARLSALLAGMAEAEDVTTALTTGDVKIGELFNATGAAVIYDGHVSTLGQTPAEDAIRQLAAWLRGQGSDQGGGAKMFHTEHLMAAYPAWRPQAGLASGVLAVFLSDDRSDMLLWFRPEEPQLVNWGGSPHKVVADDASIMPRQSFERWVETQHGVARPWAEWELEIAEQLRHGISDVVMRSLRRIAELNDRLRQSQKMEAVGQLTGGIAHDFNNLLTGITGNLELLRSRGGSAPAHDADGDQDRHIAAALSCVDRAATLTHRLLAFSRRQTLDPRPVEVGPLVASMTDLISRTAGPSIAVEVRMPPEVWGTLCDANQLENALLNLAINARDAMQEGGRLIIAAANVTLGGDAPDELARGDYVALSVTDTGAGMTQDIVARVFEPFFTTKPIGAGTGLGLSMVYGFARQSGGGTVIDSAPGRGATVRLYLPRHVGLAAIAAPVAADKPATAAAGETVMVVDDEIVVRELIGEVLGDLGYDVIEVAGAAEALRLLRSERPVDLLITDVGLPGTMNGRQLAEAARAHRAALKVLFITGYAEHGALNGGMPDAGMQMMTKPFAMDALAARIRTML